MCVCVCVSIGFCESQFKRTRLSCRGGSSAVEAVPIPRGSNRDMTFFLLGDSNSHQKICYIPAS